MLYGHILNASSVLANDTDTGPGPLTAAIVTGPAHGSAMMYTDGAYSYSANIGYIGTDSFTYQATDSTDFNSATATVTLTVLPPAPVAVNDSASTPANTAVTVSVLSNDSDPNGYSFSVTSDTTPAHGTTSINSGTTITYTPTTGYVGTDSFGYTITNSAGGTASATVTITVNNVVTLTNPGSKANNERDTVNWAVSASNVAGNA